MNFPKETLEGMYHTKEPFLESYGVPVIGRKFNYIPALTMDPPRVLTDPMNGYLRERRAENGVFSDLSKVSAAGTNNELWEDGDYNAIVKGLNADYEFDQATLNAQFKPSDVYAFMRADAERYADETIKDFFASQYEDKEEQKRAFLMDYGMSPAEAEQIMRQQKTEVAAAALKEYIANKRPMRPQGLRVDAIARNFMRNDVPMIEANGFFDPDGNLVPGVTGIGLGGAGRTMRNGGRMAARVRAEEDVRDRAIDGLPVIPVSEAEREAKLARLGTFARRNVVEPTMRNIVSTLRENPAMYNRRRAAEEREMAIGPAKEEIVKVFRKSGVESAEGFTKLSKEEAERRLIATARRMNIGTKAGRPAGGAAGKGAGGK